MTDTEWWQCSQPDALLRVLNGSSPREWPGAPMAESRSRMIGSRKEHLIGMAALADALEGGRRALDSLADLTPADLELACWPTELPPLNVLQEMRQWLNGEATSKPLDELRAGVEPYWRQTSLLQSLSNSLFPARLFSLQRRVSWREAWRRQFHLRDHAFLSDRQRVCEAVMESLSEAFSWQTSDAMSSPLGPLVHGLAQLSRGMFELADQRRGWWTSQILHYCRLGSYLLSLAGATSEAWRHEFDALMTGMRGHVVAQMATPSWQRHVPSDGEELWRELVVFVAQWCGQELDGWSRQADLCRDIAGPIFSPLISLPPGWQPSGQCLQLARLAYESGQGGRPLDEACLAAVADAALESGCPESGDWGRLLAGLRRGPGTPRNRYRGSWALDLLLGYKPGAH